MKKTVLIACLVVISSLAFATNPTGFKKFYDKYSSVSGVVSFKIPAILAKNFVEVDDPEAEAFLKQMDDLRFLVYDNVSAQALSDLNVVLKDKAYVPIMIINDSGTKVEFYMHLQGKNVEELIMTVKEPGELVVMSMQGNFTIDQAKELAKSINVDSATKQ